MSMPCFHENRRFGKTNYYNYTLNIYKLHYTLCNSLSPHESALTNTINLFLGNLIG